MDPVNYDLLHSPFSPVNDDETGFSEDELDNMEDQANEYEYE